MLGHESLEYIIFDGLFDIVRDPVPVENIVIILNEDGNTLNAMSRLKTEAADSLRRGFFC